MHLLISGLSDVSLQVVLPLLPQFSHLLGCDVVAERTQLAHFLVATIQQLVQLSKLTNFSENR